MPPVSGAPWLIVVSGWTGAGKSTMADRLATEISATVISFDWVMSALRSHDKVWAVIEDPVEVQRRVGWDLMSRVAEQQLRGERSCIVDLVAREQVREEWEDLAGRYGASFAVVECICSDIEIHRARVAGRQRLIPGWYELRWERVELGRELYVPLRDPKLILDAVEPVEANLERALKHLTAVAAD